MRDQAFVESSPYSLRPHRTEYLPFRVRLAETADDVERAMAVRAAAYSRHVPSVGSQFKIAEAEDQRSDAVLVLAESKLDGCVLGSLRLLTNAFHSLSVENEIELPEHFQDSRLMEASRLTVRNGEQGRMVTAALIKASYEISHYLDIDHTLVLARRPVDAMYRAMLFKNALEEGRTIRLSSVSDLPHGLYYMAMREADLLWRKANCALYPFMALTLHPDIKIDYERIHSKLHQMNRNPRDHRYRSPCP